MWSKVRRGEAGLSSRRPPLIPPPAAAWGDVPAPGPPARPTSARPRPPAPAQALTANDLVTYSGQLESLLAYHFLPQVAGCQGSLRSEAPRGRINHISPYQPHLPVSPSEPPSAPPAPPPLPPPPPLPTPLRPLTTPTWRAARPRRRCPPHCPGTPSLCGPPTPASRVRATHGSRQPRCHPPAAADGRRSADSLFGAVRSRPVHSRQRCVPPHAAAAMRSCATTQHSPTQAS